MRALYRSRSYPSLIVIDKENGGKADALNAGLNAATGELVCAMDADTLVEPDAMQRLVRPFLTSDDVVAAGGTILVLNDATVEGGRIVARTPRRFLPGIQTVEYLRAFLFGRLGFNRLGGNLIISGAFGLFRREAILAVGGYQHDTVGEDMELVLRLRRVGVEQDGPSRVEFVPDPVAWTEVPESRRVLGRQRDRWHRGLADVLWRHRRLLFNPRYGPMGMVVFPYFVFVELLAPIVEVIGLLGLVLGLLLGAVDGAFAVLFFLVAYGYGLVLTVLTVLLEGFIFGRYARRWDRLLLLGWALLENLGYRQLTVMWRLIGLVKYLRGRRDWGLMERTGRLGPAQSFVPIAPRSLYGAVLRIALSAGVLAIFYWGLFVSSPVSDPAEAAGSQSHALSERATTLIYAGRYDEALDSAVQLQRRFPSSHIFAQQVAIIYHQLDRPADEAAAWEQFMSTSPAPWEACPAVGAAYRAAGQADQSLAAFERCGAYDPDDADLLFYVAHANERAGDSDRAAILYQQVIDLAPNYTDAAIGLARIELRRGNPEGARRAAEAVLERQPADVDALLAAGTASLRLADLVAARRHLAHGLSIKEEYADLHLVLGIVHEEDGRLDDARRAYDRALELMPGDPDARLRRRRLGGSP